MPPSHWLQRDRLRDIDLLMCLFYIHFMSCWMTPGVSWIWSIALPQLRERWDSEIIRRVMFVLWWNKKIWKTWSCNGRACLRIYFWFIYGRLGNVWGFPRLFEIKILRFKIYWWVFQYLNFFYLPLSTYVYVYLPMYLKMSENINCSIEYWIHC